MSAIKTEAEKKTVLQPVPSVKEVNLGKTMLKNLVMGGTAGIIGATCTFPIDMVKTRLQNQRCLPGQKQMYSNMLDCFFKIFSNEGFFGLYRGLPAQLIGIAPEKAIKLTINDALRYMFTDKDTGNIKLVYEVIAGSVAGFSQVVATNPYEIVKVRLQTQALVEEAHQRKSAFSVVRELGFSGLFKGSGATLLRDVPFSAMYFSLFGNFKRILHERNGHLSTVDVFLCGITAGIIAGGTVTPADVIKTRIQVKQSSGVAYKGIRDCFFRIVREEGIRALYKGTLPRIMIISPLFGITLATYELLQNFFL